MTFAASEASLNSGEPYELHEFRLGETSAYSRYADAPADVVYNGNVFTHCFMKGGPIEAGANAIKSRTIVTTDWDNPYAAQYKICAPDPIVHYTRYKGHGADVEAIYRGDVLQVTFHQDSRKGENRRAEIVIDPSTAAMQRMGLVTRYGRQCGVELYSTQCGVLRATYKQSGTLDSVTGNVLTSTTFGSQANGYWLGGDIIINSRQRKIIVHSGNDVTISGMIPSLAAGQSFDVYPGCDHLPGVTGNCHARYNNYVAGEFRGQPNCPDDNPFSSYGIL